MKKEIKIYFAAALFSIAEEKYNKRLAENLCEYGYDVFLPQDECKGLTTATEIFMKCITGVDYSDIIVTVLDGTDVDSGTAWEIGRAYTQGKKIIGIRTDFRQRGDDGGLNCMISQSCHIVFTERSITKLTKLVDNYIRNLV